DNDPEKKKYRNVITHTVGLYATAGTARENYLINIAQESLDEDHLTYNFTNNYGKTLGGYDSDDPYTGGRYVRSTSPEDMIEAFNDFIDQANSEVGFTYSAPAIPFNPDNVAISGEWAYVPMFKPGVTTFWKGNLKRYRIGVDEFGNFFLKAKGGADVVTDGLAFRSVTDYWGSSDTNAPLKGGAASHMNNDDIARSLFTHTGTDFNASGLTLVHKDTDDDGDSVMDITEDMLGGSVTDDDERVSILDWISWESDAHEGEIGAPLHTSPVAVRYSGKNDLVLLSTTEGILHAINAGSKDGYGGGDEVWSFIPDEILPKLTEMRANNDTSDPPVFGLDGPLNVYEHGGSTYAIVGMRRGGRNYYILNIDNRKNPTFAGEIIGGTGDFADLAQTWSKPLYVQMHIPGVPHDVDVYGDSTLDATNVLIFGGGYDADTFDGDDSGGPSSPPSGGDGQTIYIVDPEDGSLLKSYKVSGGISSVAGDLLPV
ncbi:MAG: hypothetical protein GY934_23155, partial [Gammaproteobacteria bacterium]|nr:hypothetical protein [Gammaproteobacteria bacterium]